MDASLHRVAIIGGGLVGLGWAVVFARAGLAVRVFDADASVRQSAAGRLRATLADMAQHGLIADAEETAARVTVVDALSAAVGQADYVQESVFESVAVKRLRERAAWRDRRLMALVAHRRTQPGR